MIIGLSGFKGCGKSTVAKIMEFDYDIFPLSLADPLKNAVSTLFNMPRELLEGDSNKSRVWREMEAKEWSHLSGKGIFHDVEIITPRVILQKFGTDVMRNVNPDHWIDLLENRIKSLNKKIVVITDCRFLNELEICDITINIKRNVYNHDDLSRMHVSEKEHLKHSFDYTVDNSGTIKDLEEQVYSIVSQLNPLGD